MTFWEAGLVSGSLGVASVFIVSLALWLRRFVWRGAKDATND